MLSEKPRNNCRFPPARPACPSEGRLEVTPDVPAPRGRLSLEPRDRGARALRWENLPSPTLLVPGTKWAQCHGQGTSGHGALLRVGVSAGCWPLGRVLKELPGVSMASSPSPHVRAESTRGRRGAAVGGQRGRGWGSAHEEVTGPRCKGLSRYLKRLQAKLQLEPGCFLFLDSAGALKIKILPPEGFAFP